MQLKPGSIVKHYHVRYHVSLFDSNVLGGFVAEGQREGVRSAWYKHRVDVDLRIKQRVRHTTDVALGNFDGVTETMLFGGARQHGDGR